MIKREFAEHILSGRKTSTIRLGRVVPRVREVMIHSGGRPIAKAVIKRVIYKHIYELDDEDARRDGYDSVEQLIKGLEKLYRRSIDPNETVTVIEFEVVKKLTNLNEDSTYMGLTPIDIAMLANRYLREELQSEHLRVVDAVLRYKSVRAVAQKLFGSLSKRWIIRKILRECLQRLVERGIIGVGGATKRGRDGMQ